MKILSGYILGVLVAFLSLYYSGLINEKPKEIKPCECISVKDMKYYIAKEYMFIDKLQRFKKSEMDALVDSVNHYRKLQKAKVNIVEY